MEMVGALILSLLLWKGGLDVIHGVWTAGSFVAFITYAVMTYRPLKNFAELLDDLGGMLGRIDLVTNGVVGGADARLQVVQPRFELSDLLLRQLAPVAPHGDQILVFGVQLVALADQIVELLIGGLRAAN